MLELKLNQVDKMGACSIAVFSYLIWIRQAS